MNQSTAKLLLLPLIAWSALYSIRNYTGEVVTLYTFDSEGSSHATRPRALGPIDRSDQRVARQRRQSSAGRAQARRGHRLLPRDAPRRPAREGQRADGRALRLGGLDPLEDRGPRRSRSDIPGSFGLSGNSTGPASFADRATLGGISVDSTSRKLLQSSCTRSEAPIPRLRAGGACRPCRRDYPIRSGGDRFRRVVEGGRCVSTSSLLSLNKWQVGDLQLPTTTTQSLPS
jgi:hypothetical protein